MFNITAQDSYACSFSRESEALDTKQRAKISTGLMVCHYVTLVHLESKPLVSRIEEVLLERGRKTLKVYVLIYTSCWVF